LTISATKYNGKEIKRESNKDKNRINFFDISYKQVFLLMISKNLFKVKKFSEINDAFKSNLPVLRFI